MKVTPEEMLEQYRRQLAEANETIAEERAQLKRREDNLENIKTTISEYEALVEKEQQQEQESTFRDES